MLKGENPTFQNQLPFFFPLPPCTFVLENIIKVKFTLLLQTTLCGTSDRKDYGMGMAELKPVRKHSLAVGWSSEAQVGGMEGAPVRRGWGLSEVTRGDRGAGPETRLCGKGYL